MKASDLRKEKIKQEIEEERIRVVLIDEEMPEVENIDEGDVWMQPEV